MSTHFTIPCIGVDADYVSVFLEENHQELSMGAMLLTDRIGAQNLRLRKSAAGYASDWHVAGDATLIIIQQGTLRIVLRDGSFRDFFSGDLFIAKDDLPKEIPFDYMKHGHRAEVIGTDELKAVHVKLSL